MEIRLEDSFSNRFFLGLQRITEIQFFQCYSIHTAASVIVEMIDRIIRFHIISRFDYTTKRSFSETEKLLLLYLQLAAYSDTRLNMHYPVP